MIENINIHWYAELIERAYLLKEKQQFIFNYSPMYEYKIKGDKKSVYKIYRYIYKISKNGADKVDLIKKGTTGDIVRDVPCSLLTIIKPNKPYIIKQNSMAVLPINTEIHVPMYNGMCIAIAKDATQIFVGTTYTKSNEIIKSVIDSFDFTDIELYKHGNCSTGVLSVYPCTPYNKLKGEVKCLKISNGVIHCP